MKTLKNMTGDSLEQMIDYKVVDQNGGDIGTLHSLWSDPTTGAVEFLGVKTGWIFGQNHVVPAEKAELDETENVVRLPYTAVFIKEAPAVSAEAEISEEEEQNIYRHYGLNRTDDAPGNNQVGVNYGATPDKVPEAIGGAAVASASEAGIGGTQSGAPASSTNADETLGMAGTAGRLRRISRPGAGYQTASAAGTAGGRSIDDVGPTDTSARAGTTGTIPGSFSSANMFGSTGSFTAPVAADSAGASSLDPVAGMSDSLAERFGRNVTDPGDENAGLARPGGANPDAITGEPGSHPVGTGAGALAAGAAGLAIGAAIGGPVGAPLGGVIGAVVGAVGGGYAGKGIAEAVNPTAEDAYWKSNYHHAPYHEPGYEYSDYAPAYRVGYEGFSRHAGTGANFNDVEGNLAAEYESSRGDSRLTWDKAKVATRDAWDRVRDKAAPESYGS